MPNPNPDASVTVTLPTRLVATVINALRWSGMRALRRGDDAIAMDIERASDIIAGAPGAPPRRRFRVDRNREG